MQKSIVWIPAYAGMTQLAQTQHLFYQAIFDDTIDLDFIATQKARERLHIYRRNVFENLRNSLALTFPGVWILLGDDCANSVARAFIREKNHLPNSPCLHRWGADFPKFLEKLPELKTLPYLKDYAEFEWHKHLAYYAAEADALDPQIFNKISEDALLDTRIKFLPAVFILTSGFALQHIQEIVNNPNASGIDLKNETTSVIISKLNQEVITIFMPKDMGLFFQYLLQSRPLQHALHNTQADYPNFDLQAAMYILIKYQLIWEIQS